MSASFVAPFFLTLREGLEAALIVGILAAYLVKVGRRDALVQVFVGVALALALSATAAIAVIALVEGGKLPLVVQETFEGLAGVTAVVILTWMLFWMRRQGRAMKGDLERGVDHALTTGSARAIVILAFVAVLREGLETALFMFAIFSSSTDVVPTFAGALSGLVVAVGIGAAIFVGGVRVNLRTFFNVTGVVLIFVSAGLVAFSIAEFTEAGLLPVTPTVFNAGSVLPTTSPLGSLLAGLFGYRSAPTVLELVGWLAYLVPVLILFLAGDRIRRPVPSPAA